MRYALQYNVICLENIILHWHTLRALCTWKSFWPSRIQCVFRIPKLITFIPAFFSAELVLEVGVACNVLQSRPLSSRCGLFSLCYDLTMWTRGGWTVVKKSWVPMQLRLGTKGKLYWQSFSNCPSHTSCMSASLMDIPFCLSNDGDGCGGLFPNKTSEGLCAKCTKLSTLCEGTPEYTMWKVKYLIHVSTFFAEASRV